MNILYFPNAKTPQIFATSLNSTSWKQSNSDNKLHIKQRNVELSAYLENPLIIIPSDSNNKLQIYDFNQAEFLITNKNQLCEESKMKLQKFASNPNFKESLNALKALRAKAKLYLTSTICPTFE